MDPSHDRLKLFSVAIEPYQLRVSPDRLPPSYSYERYRRGAVLVEEFDLDTDYGAVCFVAVAHANRLPFLVVAQRYSPTGYSFDPGIALIPETHLLFIGAGERLLAYDLQTPTRLWEDEATVGFARWARHGDMLLMSGEIKLTAWDVHGVKRWSMFVEPPWDYEVVGHVVNLNVMGRRSAFSLEYGPT